MRFVVLCRPWCFLVWEVVTRGVAAYLAEASPEKALALRSTQATALLNLAEKTLRDLAPKKLETVAAPHEAKTPIMLLKNPPPPARPDPVRVPRFAGLAERALVSDPLNARAFRILGQLLHGLGQKQLRPSCMQQFGVRFSRARLSTG